MIRHLTKSLKQAYKRYLLYCDKAIHQETSRNSDLHEIRVFFKHLKAYDAFFVHLDKKQQTLKKRLLTYYKAIGAVRDAKIFAKQCTKFMPHEKVIHTLAQTLIMQHEKALSKVYKKYWTQKIMTDIKQVCKKQASLLWTLKGKDLLPQMIAYLKSKEQSISKLLLARGEMSDTTLHGIRTSIKDMLYLLSYASNKDTPYLQSKVNLYTALWQSLGRRNDLTQFTNFLASQHRTAPQQITFNKLIALQQQKKMQLIEQLKQHFSPSPALIAATKKWVKPKKKIA